MAGVRREIESRESNGIDDSVGGNRFAVTAFSLAKI